MKRSLDWLLIGSWLAVLAAIAAWTFFLVWVIEWVTS